MGVRVAWWLIESGSISPPPACPRGPLAPIPPDLMPHLTVPRATPHPLHRQVTATSVRLIDSMTQQLAAQWEPGAAGRITLASASPTQLVVAVGGATLVYLELGEGQISEKGRLQLDSDIACLDITPVGEYKYSISISGPLLFLVLWSGGLLCRAGMGWHTGWRGLAMVLSQG